MVTLILIVLAFSVAFGASLIERGRADASSKAAALEQYVHRSLEVSAAVAEDALSFLDRRETLEGLANDLEAHAHFSRLASRLGLGVGMIFVDAAGRVVLHSAQFPVGQIDLSDRNWFQEHLAGADRAIDGAFISRVGQGLIFVQTFAFRDDAGEFLGAINIGIRSDEILGAHALPFYDTAIVTMVVTQTGSILARDPYPEELIGASIAVPDHAAEDWVGLEARPADGRRAVTAYRALPEYGVVASVSIPLAAVLQPLIVTTLAALPILALVFLAGLVTLRYLITQQRQLRQTATRLETVLQASSLGAWQWYPKSDRNEYNARWAEMLGYRPGEIDFTQVEWRDRLHPEERERVLDSVARHVRGETAEFREEHRLRHRDGHWIWVLDAGRVVERDADGIAEVVTGVHLDITERREAEERMVTVSREMDHRAKNLLAIVQAIIGMTKATSVEAFRSALRGRIQALSRVHNLLSESRWHGSDLRDIAEQELAPYGREGGQDILIAGPRVVLEPAASQALSMTLHELATNAAKYGALSQPGATLRLSWKLSDDAASVEIAWEESGGRKSEGNPEHIGFGSQMMQVIIEGQLGGTLEFQWTEEGMRCDFSVPRSHVVECPAMLRSGAKGKKEPRPKLPPLARARRILVVEDDAFVRGDIGERLEAAGYEIAHSASTLAEAIKLADRTAIDGAVLDINLGEVVSFPVAEKLAGRGIPFVFMTGYRHDDVDMSRFADAPVVSKPCPIGDLEKALEQALQAAAPAA
jgi:PAS domain S-box-containing protein